MGKKGGGDRGREGNRKYDKFEKTDLREPTITPKDFCFLFQRAINQMVKKGKKIKEKENKKLEFLHSIGFSNSYPWSTLHILVQFIFNFDTQTSIVFLTKEDKKHRQTCKFARITTWKRKPSPPPTTF